MRLTQERLAPLFDVLGHAAQTDAELGEVLDELIARRAHYTGVLARPPGHRRPAG
jgi:hypothetical protein